jgi:hypothetical protein
MDLKGFSSPRGHYQSGSRSPHEGHRDRSIAFATEGWPSLDLPLHDSFQVKWVPVRG